MMPQCVSGAGTRRRPSRATTAALLAGILLSSPCLADESTLIRFELADQFDREHSHMDVQGQFLLLLGSDRGGSSYQGKWVDALRASVSARGATKAVQIIEVADLRGVPFFIKGSVKRRFPSDKRQWVLMDWKGSLARAYRFEKNVCNVLLFDRSGKLVQRYAVRDPDQPALDAIGRLLDTQLTTNDALR